MSTQYIKRRKTKEGATATSTDAPIYVDSDDNILKFIPGGPGSTTEIQIIDASSVQTLTNKTMSATIADSGGQVFNVKASPYLATGLGVADDSVAVQAAIDAAATLGGVVYFPAGTYLVTNIVLKTAVYLKGAGVEATFVTRYGSGDVFISQNFATLTGGNTTGGIHDFGISDMTISGAYDSDSVQTTTLNGSHNSSVTTITVASTSGFPTSGSIIIQSPTGITDGLGEVITYSGVTSTTFTGCTRAAENTVAAAHSTSDLVFPRVSGYGIRIYGFSYNLTNLIIKRTRQDGIYSEWSTSSGAISPNSMEATLDNIKIHHCLAHGLNFLGPHDSKMNKITPFSNFLIGIRDVSAAAAENFVNCHSYGKQVYSWYLGAGGMLTNCIGEQGVNGQFAIMQNETLLSNCWAFGTAGTAVKGFILGDGTHSVKYCRIDGYSRSCEAGAVDFTGDGGNNTVKINIYQLTGNEIVGTPAASTFLQFGDGGAGGTVNQNLMQFPTSTTSKVILGGTSGSPLEVFSAQDPIASNNSGNSAYYALYLHKTSFATGAGIGIGFGDSNAPNIQASIISQRIGSGIGTLEFWTSATASTVLKRMAISETGAITFSSVATLTLPTSAGYAPTANGEIGFDSTQLAYSAGGAGTVNGKFPRVLYASTSTTDTLAAATISTTETVFAQAYTIPANYLIANKLLRITLNFLFTTSGSPPTWTITIRLGGIGGARVFLHGGGGPTASQTDSVAGVTFLMSAMAAPGASVQVVAGECGAGIGALNSRNVVTQPANVATNASKQLVVTQTFSANTAGNTITLAQIVIEELN